MHDLTQDTGASITIGLTVEIRPLPPFSMASLNINTDLLILIISKKYNYHKGFYKQWPVLLLFAVSGVNEPQHPRV